MNRGSRDAVCHAGAAGGQGWKNSGRELLEETRGVSGLWDGAGNRIRTGDPQLGKRLHSECNEYQPSQPFTNSNNVSTADGPHPAGDLHPVTTGTAIPTPRVAPVLRTAATSGSSPATPRGQDGSQGNLLSVRAVAARLGVSTATVYKVVAEGSLLHVRVSNTIRIAPADVDAFVACQRSK